MIHAEFLFVLATFAMALAPKPEALQRMEQSRQAITAARFEWSRIDPSKTPSGEERELFHTTRFSGADQLEIRHGDIDGVMIPDKIGEDLSCSELRFLKKNDEHWFHGEDTFSANVSSSDRVHSIFDLRALGMAPRAAARMTTSQYMPAEPESYEETIEGTGFITSRRNSSMGLHLRGTSTPARTTLRSDALRLRTETSLETWTASMSRLTASGFRCRPRFIRRASRQVEFS